MIKKPNNMIEVVEYLREYVVEHQIVDVVAELDFIANSVKRSGEWPLVPYQANKTEIQKLVELRDSCPIDWLCEEYSKLLEDLGYSEPSATAIEYMDKGAVEFAYDEKRPVNCRNRLRDEGKPYPKSGCNSCSFGGMTGCPHERAVTDDGVK